MSSVESHTDKNIIRVQLRQNVVLKAMDEAAQVELESLLTVVECSKGDHLLHQGVHEMEQYFVLDGILKRVVANQQAKEMILRSQAAPRPWVHRFLCWMAFSNGWCPTSRPKR